MVITMNRWAAACPVVCMLVMSVSATGVGPIDFSGVWVLDKGRSQGLPDTLANLSGYIMAVTQDDNQLAIETKVAAGGQERSVQTLTYKLDGSETKGEIAGRIAGPATLKSQWKSDGRVLELTAVRRLSAQGIEYAVTIKDTLELVEDGKALKMRRAIESPRNVQESTWIFNKP